MARPGKVTNPGSIRASLRFLGPCDGKPAAYGRQREKDNLPLVDVVVDIEDLRSSAKDCALEREGFALVERPTRIQDVIDLDTRRTIYARELETLILDLTGADKVVALGSSVIRRSEKSRGYLAPGTSVPGRFVHCDYSPNPSGSTYWFERALDPEEADWRRGRRFAIYNVWRALSPPPHDAPLALCDVRSLRAGDRVAADCIVDPEGEPEWSFENSLFRYGAHQRWTYFSNVRPDEVLVFKGFDSDPSCSEGVPHCAFDDSTCPPDAPPRESIDERVIAFF